MLKTIAGLHGVTVLSKDAQKKLFGGLAGTCGNVLTQMDGSRCVSGGISRDTAIQNSADFNNGGGVYGSGGFVSITDVNWCCASCGNFTECEDYFDA